MATLSANTFYEYTNQRFGSFSGGAWTAGLGNVPHPTYLKDSTTGDTVVQLNAITIGGFNGLNN